MSKDSRRMFISNRTVFNLIEITAFLLPIFPQNILYRALILTSYLLGHMFGLQHAYLLFKLKHLKN